VVAGIVENNWEICGLVPAYFEQGGYPGVHQGCGGVKPWIFDSSTQDSKLRSTRVASISESLQTRKSWTS
jgi:hypothetical protein